MWEVTHKKSPYGKSLFSEIEQFVITGNRLPFQQSVPKDIRKLIKNCWNDSKFLYLIINKKDPLQRPIASVIREKLKSFIG